MYLEKWLQTECDLSKKEVRRLALSGQIWINGERCLDVRRSVEPSVHHVVVKGHALSQQQAHSYFLLNKPQGVVSAVHDQKYPTVLDCLRPADRTSGCTHVGRLDRSTEGLLLLTDNGPLVRRLAFPEKKVVKVYRAQVTGQLTAAAQRAFTKGIVFADGTQCQPAELRLLQTETARDTSWAEVRLSEGKFHQVKKMFLACGHKVLYLQRTHFGPFELTADLPVGSYRALTQAELVKMADLL